MPQPVTHLINIAFTRYSLCNSIVPAKVTTLFRLTANIDYVTCDACLKKYRKLTRPDLDLFKDYKDRTRRAS